MKNLYYPETVKKIENDLINGGLSETDLVSKAAKNIAALLEPDLSYTVVCGKGNNGADGFCIALLLKERGIDVKAYRVSREMSAGQKYFYDLCLKQDIVFDFSDGIPVGDVILDCIFGIGFNGEAEGEYLAAIKFINEKKAAGTAVYSVDVPSGLNARNGLKKECVNADKTFIIGYLKTGEFLADAKDATGDKVFIDIGFPYCPPDAYLVESSDVKKVFKKRRCNSNKYDYGFAGIMGGSENFSGAVKLANVAAAACSSGAGVVRLVVGENIKNYVAPYLLESTLFTLGSDGKNIVFDENELFNAINKLDSLAVGMGFGDNEETKKVVSFLLKNFKGELIIDADGLNALKNDVSVFLCAAPSHIVITPHTREFSRLSGHSDQEILADPLTCAKNFAKRHNVTVLLKGATTVVTDGKAVFLVDRGDAGMATAGSGDVLSGVLSAISGYVGGVSAVYCAPFICGLAAELARTEICEISHTASDTANYVKKAISKIYCDE